MSRHAYLTAAAILAVAALTLVAIDRRTPAPPTGPEHGSPPATATEPRAATPTLYCEFNNFADLTPLVGFYFRDDDARASAAYTLIFTRDRDGSEEAPAASGQPPLWTLDSADDPAVLRAPDGDTAINLYAYDASGPGMRWFEAGLRSTRFRNLGGRCRRSP